MPIEEHADVAHDEAADDGAEKIGGAAQADVELGCCLARERVARRAGAVQRGELVVCAVVSLDVSRREFATHR